MARNASGEFYYPPGTAAVPDEVARSAHVNQRFAELAQDANTPRPVLVGGTGSSTAAGALANLGGLNAVPTGVRSVAFLQSPAAKGIGETAAGSTLRPAGVRSDGGLHVGGAILQGQWTALGACPAGGATLFVRIS